MCVCVYVIEQDVRILSASGRRRQRRRRREGRRDSANEKFYTSARVGRRDRRAFLATCCSRPTIFGILGYSIVISCSSATSNSASMSSEMIPRVGIARLAHKRAHSAREMFSFDPTVSRTFLLHEYIVCTVGCKR